VGIRENNLVSSGECWAWNSGRKQLPSLRSCCSSTHVLTHAVENSCQQIQEKKTTRLRAHTEWFKFYRRLPDCILPRFVWIAAKKGKHRALFSFLITRNIKLRFIKPAVLWIACLLNSDAVSEENCSIVSGNWTTRQGTLRGVWSTQHKWELLAGVQVS
jgi:hypothetical protein